MESIIWEFLDSNFLFLESQYDSWYNEGLIQEVDAGYPVDIVYFDISEAFEVIPNQIKAKGSWYSLHRVAGSRNWIRDQGKQVVLTGKKSKLP